MGYPGHVRNGVVVLDEAVRLPEGAAVRVELAEDDEAAERLPTLAERLKDVIGIVEGPPDLAENHDHHIHGTPKR
jgi:predicted DNA-binding antitoxin AbrB/MazE fold protein